MNTVATVEKTAKPIDVFRHQLDNMAGQFAKALPAHIPVERFARVVMTAVQNNPKLLNCTQQSLWNACMRAAQDGLLPDGREGAIVPYGENDESGKRSSDIAQWMPMIGGLRKKARNSGEISTWEVHCVYENDQFQFELGDEPFIRHAPALADRGKIIAAYSIAVLKDGSKSREVMSIKEIEGVRSKSKAKKGPWNDDVFYPEMCRKVVARRHSKVLPASTDLDDLLRQDDALYDLEGAREEAQANRPKSLAGKLDLIAGSAAAEAHQSAETAEDKAPTAEIDGEVVKTDEPPKKLPDAESAALAKALLAKLAKVGTPEALEKWRVDAFASLDNMTAEDAEDVRKAWQAKSEAFGEDAPP